MHRMTEGKINKFSNVIVEKLTKEKKKPADELNKKSILE